MTVALALAITVGERLEPLATSDMLNGSSVGICLLDDMGKEKYAKNADKRLVPASNQKLFTAIYVLEQLGPDRPESDGYLRFAVGPVRFLLDSVDDPLQPLQLAVRPGGEGSSRPPPRVGWGAVRRAA